VLVLLAGGAAVAGAAAGVPGLRGLFQKGDDGKPEMVIRDENGNVLRRSKVKPGELVITLPEPGADEPIEDDDR
jgi:hypothetical protein